MQFYAPTSENDELAVPTEFPGNPLMTPPYYPSACFEAAAVQCLPNNGSFTDLLLDQQSQEYWDTMICPSMTTTTAGYPNVTTPPLQLYDLYLQAPPIPPSSEPSESLMMMTTTTTTAGYPNVMTPPLQACDFYVQAPPAPPPPPLPSETPQQQQQPATTKRIIKEKLYQCQRCSKRFTRLYNLKSHQNIHTKERPFACTFENCSWKFARPHDLKRHMLLHTGEKPHGCPYCERRFPRRDALLRHWKVDPTCRAAYKANPPTHKRRRTR